MYWFYSETDKCGKRWRKTQAGHYRSVASIKSTTPGRDFVCVNIYALHLLWFFRLIYTTKSWILSTLGGNGFPDLFLPQHIFKIRKNFSNSCNSKTNRTAAKLFSIFGKDWSSIYPLSIPPLSQRKGWTIVPLLDLPQAGVLPSVVSISLQ